MVGRFKLTILTLAGASLMLVSGGPLRAQQASQVGGRFLVLIPPFHATQNAGDGFGRDGAKKLRSLINTLETHQPVDENDVKKEVKRFHLKMEDLDCVKTRQLASQMNAQVALCADYHPQGADDQAVEATFYDVRSGEAFKVPQTTVPKNKPDSAASYIFHAFDTYVQEIRANQFCQQYAASNDFQNALEECDKAIQLNPGATSAHYVRARIYFQQNQYDSAMTELETVLRQDPNRTDALQLAGYISAKQGNDQKASRYYLHYLELNPSDARTRIAIAFEEDTAGNPGGALQLIEQGLKTDSTNVELLEQYSAFAFHAAIQGMGKAGSKSDSAAAEAQANQYLQKAVGAGQKLLRIQGKETPVGILRNTILGLDKLNQPDQAVQVARQAIQAHPGESELWSAYADALHQSGQVDSAVVALDSVRALDPSNPTATLKQGQWLLQAGRLQDAVNALKASAAGGSKQADEAAQMLFSDAYTNGYTKHKYDFLVSGVAAARTLPNLSAHMQEQLTFWQAYGIYLGAVEEQKANTIKSAKATLPKFEQVAELLKHVGDYPATVGIPVKQLTSNVSTYIEIQKAIIQRGTT